MINDIPPILAVSSFNLHNLQGEGFGLDQVYLKQIF